MARLSQPELIVHSSLGLQALCERLHSVPTCDILELGPVRSGNVEFWARFSPSLFIADLRSSLPLPGPRWTDEEEFIEPDWQDLLGLPSRRCYDVILAWDLLNYCELPVVSSLVRHLAQFCRPGTILFTLIYDQKQMPDSATVYHIADESHLRYESPGQQMRLCPRHQPRALAGVMAGFRTSSSFRLKNGVVEYLFEYEGR